MLQAQAGVGNTVRVLELMSAYANEKEFTVWETLVGNLSNLSHLLAHTDFHDKFKRFAEKLFHNVAERVGWLPQPDEGKRSCNACQKPYNNIPNRSTNTNDEIHGNSSPWSLW